MWIIVILFPVGEKPRTEELSDNRSHSPRMTEDIDVERTLGGSQAWSFQQSSRAYVLMPQWLE